MGYKELLKTEIKRSKLSLREISRRSRDETSTPVSQAYISQLLKGDAPPPSDAVTRAIAEVIGADPEPLIKEGYLDRAPKAILKEIIDVEGTRNTAVNMSLKEIIEFIDRNYGLNNQLRNIIVHPLTVHYGISAEEFFLLPKFDQLHQLQNNLSFDNKIFLLGKIASFINSNQLETITENNNLAELIKEISAGSEKQIQALKKIWEVIRMISE